MMERWEVIVMVMMAQALLHYFPWRALLKGKDLPRLMAYTLGLLGMMVPFTGWLWDRGDITVLRMMWMVIGSAGLMVFALYGLDRYLDLAMKEMEAGEREHAQKKE